MKLPKSTEPPLISRIKILSNLKIDEHRVPQDGRFKFIIGPWLDQGRGRVVVGWRATPTFQPRDQLVVLFNFEPVAVEVGIDFGLAGKWVKLADIDHVNDLPPFGNNSRDNSATIETNGFLADFVLPSSSGFIYKWEH